MAQMTLDRWRGRPGILGTLVAQWDIWRITHEVRRIVARSRSYDEKQASAVMVSWLCCKRTVWATNPARGCLRCPK